VGAAELEIASLHLQSPGWAEALQRFARSGGFAGCGAPLPHQPIDVLWGADDRILRAPQKRAALALLGERVRELDACGHLPHLDQPATVATTWLAKPPLPMPGPLHP
jgi:pimeloyl-ACP methyl ester carboxylesterase